MKKLRTYLRDSLGASMTEYIVIVAVVVVIAIAAFTIFGDRIKEAFTSAGDSITDAAGTVQERVDSE